MSIARRWRVEVSADCDQLVAIEPGVLSGKRDLTAHDIATIKEAIQHLIGFVGDDGSLPCFFCRGDGWVAIEYDGSITPCPACGDEKTPNNAADPASGGENNGDHQ